ncbi:MAG: outer membrane protein assembly factor BamB [Gammaproteobacteria bacterium]
MWKLIVFSLAALVLGACGSSSRELTRQPTPLSNISTAIEINELWRSSAGGGIEEQYVRLNPVVNRDIVYVTDVGGEVTALGAEDGERLWRANTDTRAAGGFNGGDRVIALGTVDGELVGLASADGAELWRTGLSSEVTAVSRTELGVLAVRTLDSRVYGLDEESGAVLWQWASKSPTLTLRGSGAPIVSDGRFVAGMDNGKLVALSAPDGRVLWETAIASPRGASELERMVDIDGQVKEQDGLVYVVSFQGNIAAVTLAEGRVLWSRELSSYTGLDVEIGKVYSTDEDSNVWAFDASNGASLWKQEKLKYRDITSPAVVGDYVIVGDSQGYVHWLSKFDGHLVARRRVDGSGILSSPQVMNDRVYVLGNSGRIVVLEAAPQG